MKSLFNDTNSKSLCNVLSDKPKKLDSVQIKDLLGILELGTCRLLSYVRQQILKKEKPVKRKRQSIKTFTYKKSTQTQNKSLLKNVTTILKNSFKHLQAAGAPSVQTSPYPLALATINGEMRAAQKSKFRSAIAHISSDMFSSEIPSLVNPTIILDFLFYLHMPPPSCIRTYDQLSDHLWNQCVHQLLTQTLACSIYIVIDKPDFLPPPRALVHASRSKKTSHTGPTPPIGSTLSVPHGSEYLSLLNVPYFKAALIEYLTLQFVTKAQQQLTSIVVDSPSLYNPKSISKHGVVELPSNEQREADYALWHHAIHCQGSDVLIVSGDVWVHGLAL